MSEIEYVRVDDLDHSVPRYFDPDLDRLFARVYAYYRGKGFTCIILSHAFTLITLLWVICVIGVVVEFVDFSKLFSVRDLSDAFDWHFPVNPLFWLLILMFVGGWIAIAIRSIRRMLSLFQTRTFYANYLRISEEDLQTVDWSYVARRITRIPKLCITKNEPLTELDVVHRIMRRENYLIAMVDQEIIPSSMRVILIGEISIFNHLFEWIFMRVFSTTLFEDNNLRREVLLAKTDALYRKQLVDIMRSKFRVIGLTLLALSPVILVFGLVYLLFRFGEEIKSRPSWLGIRQWSRISRWQLRHLNELPHFFQNRLNRAYKMSLNYVEQFPTNYLVILTRFFMFLLGSIVVMILLLSFLDDDFLTNVSILGHNGLWYLGVCGSMLALCRAVLPDENLIFEPEKTMDLVYEHTQHKPSHWIAQCHSYRVLAEFERLFEYRFFGLMSDLFSIIVSPLVAAFFVPDWCEQIIMFVSENTVEVEGVGYVCSLANFDFKKYGDPDFGSEVVGNTVLRNPAGKLERSFLNFAKNFPQWNPTEDGRRFLQIMEQYLERMPLPIASSTASSSAFSSMSSNTMGASYFSQQTTTNMGASLASLDSTQLNALQLRFMQEQKLGALSNSRMPSSSSSTSSSSTTSPSPTSGPSTLSRRSFV